MAVWRRMLILLTVFLTGAAIMVVELLGVRLISPWFGTGLHVWAALISVALAALAVGYFVGGWLADRKPVAGRFHLLVVLGAAGVGLIPLYAPALIPAFVPVGLRAGALLAATGTFFPPLFLLACVSPFAIRISADRLDNVGMTAGRIYAVSTLGSVAGTLATGGSSTRSLSRPASTCRASCGTSRRPAASRRFASTGTRWRPCSTSGSTRATGRTRSRDGISSPPSVWNGPS